MTECLICVPVGRGHLLLETSMPSPRSGVLPLLMYLADWVATLDLKVLNNGKVTSERGVFVYHTDVTFVEGSIAWRFVVGMCLTRSHLDCTYTLCTDLGCEGADLVP